MSKYDDKAIIFPPVVTSGTAEGDPKSIPIGCNTKINMNGCYAGDRATLTCKKIFLSSFEVFQSNNTDSRQMRTA